MNRHTLFFTLAVIGQVLILAAVPAQNIYTRATGKSIILKSSPSSPYDGLNGYYVILNLEISDPTSFTGTKYPYGTQPLYAILEKDGEGIWHPVSLTNAFPSGLPENRVAIRGHYSSRGIEYGIEDFIIPASERSEIASELMGNSSQARVEIKVDSSGNAALVRLIIGKRIYGY
jgi:uncharacterized membrane-anchored protein